MNRRRLAVRSLRGRIVLLVLGLLAVALLVVTVSVTIALHGFLLTRLDQQLIAAGNRFSVSLEHNEHDADNSPEQFASVEGQPAGTLGARVLNGTVTVAAIVGEHEKSEELAETAQQVLAGLKPSTTLHSITLPGIGAYRLLVTTGQDKDILITGLPESFVNDVIDRLVIIEAVVFGVALLLVAVSGAGLTAVALRPLRRVGEIAARVAAQPLAVGEVSLPERVPPGQPGSEIHAVASAMNSMLDQVQSALNQRQESEEQLRRFLADASHELRTPVAVIRSRSELARLVGEGTSLPEVTYCLERITSESARMGRLVEDLLLLARLDSGRPLAHDDVDLTRIVLTVVDDARLTAPRHRWQLRLPEAPIHATGDEHALHQLITNLVTNAGVHTPDDTSVTVKLATTSDHVTFTVTDTGPGIDESVRERVFERFARGGDGRSTTSGSTGLGLPIAAAIAKAHGGTVNLDRKNGQTIVQVAMPLNYPLEISTSSQAGGRAAFG